MIAACFAPSLLQKRGLMEREWLQAGSSHFNENSHFYRTLQYEVVISSGWDFFSHYWCFSSVLQWLVLLVYTEICGWMLAILCYMAHNSLRGGVDLLIYSYQVVHGSKSHIFSWETEMLFVCVFVVAYFRKLVCVIQLEFRSQVNPIE